MNSGKQYNPTTETTNNHGKHEQLIYIGISAMHNFKGKSFEEIRLDDMKSGGLGGQ